MMKRLDALPMVTRLCIAVLLLTIVPTALAQESASSAEHFPFVIPGDDGLDFFLAKLHEHEIYALDGQGQRKGKASNELGQEYETLWYEVLEK